MLTYMVIFRWDEVYKTLFHLKYLVCIIHQIIHTPYLYHTYQAVYWGNCIALCQGIIP